MQPWFPLTLSFFGPLGAPVLPRDSFLIQKKWGISLTLGLDSGGCPAQQAVSAGDILLTVWKRCCFSWREDEWMPVGENHITIYAHDGRKKCYHWFVITHYVTCWSTLQVRLDICTSPVHLFRYLYILWFEFDVILMLCRSQDRSQTWVFIPLNLNKRKSTFQLHN